jgi:hypothetical protein
VDVKRRYGDSLLLLSQSFPSKTYRVLANSVKAGSSAGGRGKEGIYVDSPVALTYSSKTYRVLANSLSRPTIGRWTRKRRYPTTDDTMWAHAEAFTDTDQSESGGS